MGEGLLPWVQRVVSCRTLLHAPRGGTGSVLRQQREGKPDGLGLSQAWLHAPPDIEDEREKERNAGGYEGSMCIVCGAVDAEQARPAARGLAVALWAAPCSMLRLSTAGFQKQSSLEQSLSMGGCQCQCQCQCERERRGAPPTRQQIDCPHQRQQTQDSRPRAHSSVCLRPSVAEGLVDNGQEATAPPPITAAHGSLSRLHGEHADQDAHRPKHFSNLSGRSLEGPRPAGGGDRGDQAPLASAGTVLALQEEASMSAALSKAPMLWRRMGVDLATLQISSAALLPPSCSF
ncbi:hypothetical protein COCVIDRAFT_39646 [Bipolaris victoriae FI3]|uniref:Uncharacterized protein n=1 Tax=Bipolaris victoriae (strain FI3) TaxID=930091 RepID=W7ECW8_BIPV3|nr:hypothetical protein COCVIDRAFT_39646 [Bipolaris victoriae FI3]